MKDVLFLGRMGNEETKKIISLFDQLLPTSPQSDLSWKELLLVYKNSAIIPSLFDIFQSTSELFYRYHSLNGLKVCLHNVLSTLSQTEINYIKKIIVEIYKNEENPYFKSLISKIICFLIQQTRQSWKEIDHLIIASPPNSTKYFTVLRCYSAYFATDSQISFAKVQQCFDLFSVSGDQNKNILRALKFLLSFAERKQISYFHEKIRYLLENILLLNKCDDFNYLCKVISQNYNKVFDVLPLLFFVQNLSNFSLNPSILVTMRYFVNSKINDLNLNVNDLMTTMNQEIALSNFLFSLDFDGIPTNSDDFKVLCKCLPFDYVRQTISQLISIGNRQSLLTAIPLFESFTKAFGGTTDCYSFLCECLKCDDFLVKKMAINTLHDIRFSLKHFLQPNIINFLCEWAFCTHQEKDIESKQTTVDLLIFISKFLPEIDDISPILNDLFQFTLNILGTGSEPEIIDILLIYHNMIIKNPHNFETVSAQMLEIVIQLAQLNLSDEICCASFNCLQSLLFVNPSFFEPYINNFLNNIRSVYHLKFISVLLAFFGDKISNLIHEEMPRFIQICDLPTEDPVKLLVSLEAEITFLVFYNTFEFLDSVLKNLILVIRISDIEMYQSYESTLIMLFQCLSKNMMFDINSFLIPALTQLLQSSVNYNEIVFNVLFLLIDIFEERVQIIFFIDYSISQFVNILETNTFREELLHNANYYCQFFETVIEKDFYFRNNYINEKMDFLIKICFNTLSANSQNVVLYCLRILLYFEKYRVINNDDLVFSVVGNISNSDNEISCTAAQFVILMEQKDKNAFAKFRDFIFNASLERLNICIDQELSEKLIYILLNFQIDNTMYKLILSHFPVRVNKELFSVCYNWLVDSINCFSEDETQFALKSVVQFLCLDIRELLNDEIIEIRLLEKIAKIISSVNEETISEYLQKDPKLINVFISHWKYVKLLVLNR